MEINTFSLQYIYIKKAGFSVNTKFYKTTIDLCCFLPLFFFLFKSCFKKDKKCTDTLIRHKQIFCTNHVSSDCLKKIAIQVLTIKSVRGYLFLEIFFFFF